MAAVRNRRRSAHLGVSCPPGRAGPGRAPNQACCSAVGTATAAASKKDPVKAVVAPRFLRPPRKPGREDGRTAAEKQVAAAPPLLARLRES